MAVGIMMVALPSAFGSSYLTSDYYEMGDFLTVGGSFIGYTTIDIVGDDFKKSYGFDVTGRAEFGLPITLEKGYTPGFYDVIVTEGNKTSIHKFGLEKIIPVFTLYSEKNMIPLNEYAFFFGQVIGIEPKDYSFNGNVLIQILDSNGNLVEDNWQQRKETSRGNNELATKSQFRALINNGDTFRITQEDANIFGDKGSKSIRPVLDNGYRLYIKMDPIIYEPFTWYTLRVTHDGLVKEVDFMVTDYKDSFCVTELKESERFNIEENPFYYKECE